MSQSPARVELAEKGTLFLDEIADLDMGLQSKIASIRPKMARFPGLAAI